MVVSNQTLLWGAGEMAADSGRNAPNRGKSTPALCQDFPTSSFTTTGHGCIRILMQSGMSNLAGRVLAPRAPQHLLSLHVGARASWQSGHIHPGTAPQVSSPSSAVGPGQAGSTDSTVQEQRSLSDVSADFGVTAHTQQSHSMQPSHFCLRGMVWGVGQQFWLKQSWQGPLPPQPGCARFPSLAVRTLRRRLPD